MFNTLPGRSFPLGATVSPEGVNFCVYVNVAGREIKGFGVGKLFVFNRKKLLSEVATLAEQAV